MSEEAPEARGVENARVVDLVSFDEEKGEVVLAMIETRPWGSDPAQIRQIEDKFNSYLAYVLDGHLVKQYPQYEGRRVRFRLECAESPGAAQRSFLTAVQNFAAGEDIAFELAVIVG